MLTNSSCSQFMSWDAIIRQNVDTEVEAAKLSCDLDYARVSLY